MKVERMILIAFLGNFLVNNVAGGLAALAPANPNAASQLQQMMSAQYITFVILGAITVGIVAWWYLMRTPREGGLMQGLTFGVVGFVIAVVTAFVMGLSQLLVQTQSLSQAASVIPKFFPYLANWTTLFLLLIWVVPAVLAGLIMQKRMGAPAPQSMSSGGTM